MRPRALPSLTMQVVSSWKPVELVKHDLSLVNPRCLFLTTFLSSVCLEIAYTKTGSTVSPGPELMLTGLHFLNLLQMAVVFALLQSFSTSDLHDLSKVRQWLCNDVSQLPASLDASHKVFSIYDGK